MKSQAALLVIFDGNNPARQIDLEQYKKPEISFGRNPENDLVLSSMLVSGRHGRLIRKDGVWIMEDRAAYDVSGSTNGLIYHNASVNSVRLADGDFIRIDDGVETIAEGVLFIFSTSDSSDGWKALSLYDKASISIGRKRNCTICLEHNGVSGTHAVIERRPDGYYISDASSSNGTIVNDTRLTGTVRLHEKDIISITNSKLIFTSSTIFYCSYNRGVSIDAMNVVIERKNGMKRFVTCNNVSLKINPGELVAIIGGSGAGKSTIMNAMSGYLKPKSGEVYINGSNLYDHFDVLKQMIGYVPQADIVYDNLKLSDMLDYTAKLRLPKDTSSEEREKAVEKALQMVELTEKRDSMIKALSGGQKKRASIAVELLSDPSLLFLDEPASGLDPGTERNLMTSLRGMANMGKTIVLVTHSTLQLRMCDKIIFMGKGGNLCFFGSYEEALEFFRIDDIVDVYRILTDESEKWREAYGNRYHEPIVRRTAESPKKDGKIRGKNQLPILAGRYFRLVINDRQRLLLLLLQAPLLAAIISLVGDGNQFSQYEMTKSLLFALSCSGFWVGMLNAIQEICKERSILKREYMTGVSLTSYILSKILVLGTLCLIQSLMIVAVFALLVGLPEKGVIIGAFWEFFVTTFLTSISSAVMGLFVSSLFNNADRAMTMAPILLMPQILFSGLLFKLEGVTKVISYLTVCRWSMEGYGTVSDLNALDLRLQTEGLPIPHEAEEFFTYTSEHLLRSWGIMIAFSVVLLIITRIMITSIGREKG